MTARRGGRRSRLAAGVLATLVAACAGSPSAPSRNPTPPPPPPPELSGASRGASEGQTDIRLIDANPLPGSTIAGCGGGASGCAGRIRMTLRLRSPTGGPALGFLAFLHSDRATACFRSILPALELPGGADRELEVVFAPMDTDEACPTPLHITHLAVVVEGSGAVFARQEWGLVYDLVR